MESTLQILIKKYPALAYFDITDALTPEQLQFITPELLSEPKNGTPEAKQTHKALRKFAAIADQKIKNGRQLYKTIKQHNENIESIILNNAKLKSLEALEYKYYSQLAQLQLASNEVRSISPLKRLKAPQLEEIDLSSNAIENVSPLKEVLWPKLRILNLSHNNICSIERLPLHYFRSIKAINLSDNFIRQAKCLRKCITKEMTNLKHLNLSSNEIVELKWLTECNFYKLESLNLRNNRYCCFTEIEKVRMSQTQSEIGRICISHYEILVSSMTKQSNYTLEYRKLSRHKLSAKIEPQQQRSNRQNIQKSRRLILY